MTEKEFHEWCLCIFEKIESSEHFKNIDNKISKYFYHTFIKIKRTYFAIQQINNGKWENSYVESIPLIRILAEGYFHLCYILDEEDNEKIDDGYKKLSELQAFKVARYFHDLGAKLQPDEEDFVKKHFEKKTKPKPPKYLEYINELVKKTHNEYLYTRLYTEFSSYVHFNPATHVLYGKQSEDKGFVFNSFQENKELYDSLKNFTNGIIILVFTRIIGNLNDKPLYDEFYKYYDEESRSFKFF